MKVRGIKNYKDLCLEIDIQKIRVREIENEIRQLKKLLEGPKELTGIDYSKQPGGQIIHIPLDRIFDRAVRLEKKLNIEKEILKEKIKAKKKIDERLLKLKGLDYKVVYMRDIEGKTLQQIADELGYSKRWIEKISARNKLDGESSANSMV